jgi:thiamine pyrophosphate-dependent acetolactate synthase large subunit-like protein
VLVADAIATTLEADGIADAFGLIGSGNLVFTNALRDAGIDFHAARHESNATSMADGYARATGRVAVVSVHQGPGFTNTLTHVTEAAKGRIPMLVLAADTPASARWSNFKIDQEAFALDTGALAERVRTAESAGADAARALRRAREARRPVVLNIPTDLVSRDAGSISPDGAHDAPVPELPRDAVPDVVELIERSQRPAILAGRGAVLANAGQALSQLGERIDAVLATSAGAHGLFNNVPTSVGIAGGFSSPAAVELLGQADLVLAFGASLNRWTTRHGELFSPHARVVQVDNETDALGAQYGVTVGITADAEALTTALVAELGDRRGNGGFATTALAENAFRPWRDEPFDDRSTAATIDPRSFSIALDALLPDERTVVTDGGHYIGYPSMYLRVPDARGFIFPQGFQAIGQGLGAAIGAAVGRPDRLTVAALGDGGALMALSDLETIARYGLPMLVVVYNDAAYGAEAHHFEPMGHRVDLVRFPDTDFAAIARAVGIEGLTVRIRADLDPLTPWLARRNGPMLIDVKVNPDVRAEWLEAAFKEH